MSIIQVENISKKYIISHKGGQRSKYNSLGETITNKIKGFLPFTKSSKQNTKNQKEEFWALKDISFEVNQGDKIGIIGRNGAGKSTLLKILSRITEPTKGKVKIKGRIASLLEVGTGFHPELTGRENIFLNGAILGMKKEEIKRKFDEIVAFSEIEKFLDTPVKRYSSGMYVRLAFAVAAHLESEILLVDEVLAVGDAEFQKKCLGKMEDVSKEGRTVLFVSHNMSAVRTLCNKGLVLSSGNILFHGDINDTINTYQKSGYNKQHWVGRDGDSFISILETKVYDADNNKSFANNNDIFIKIVINLSDSFNDLVIGFTLHSIYGNPIATALYNDYNQHTYLEKGVYELDFCIPAYTLATGQYFVNFNISIPYIKLINSEIINLSFNVFAPDSKGNKFNIENNRSFNSIIRLNWFKSIFKK